MENDLISRQKAIDAIYKVFSYAYCDNCEKGMDEDLCGDCHRKYQNWAASKEVIENTLNNLPSAQPEPTLEQIKEYCYKRCLSIVDNALLYKYAQAEIHPKSARTFVELVVEYPDPELCTYKEYKGKPYYSIKYIENGETYVGYGTYNPEVLSQYLKEYFISSAVQEIIRCKDCKWKQGSECVRFAEVRPFPNDFCSRAERRADEGLD